VAWRRKRPQRRQCRRWRRRQSSLFWRQRQAVQATVALTCRDAARCAACCADARAACSSRLSGGACLLQAASGAAPSRATPSQWTVPTRAAVGLRNRGNTCFLNSTLQALTHTPALAVRPARRGCAAGTRSDARGAAYGAGPSSHDKLPRRAVRAVRPAQTDPHRPLCDLRCVARRGASHRAAVIATLILQPRCWRLALALRSSSHSYR